MKIKLADGSHFVFENKLVPLFELLAGYREMFGGAKGAEGVGAEDVEIDLSGNAGLTAPIFMEAMAAIYNPTLDSATIAPKVMDALNYLGYKTCAIKINTKHCLRCAAIAVGARRLPTVCEDCGPPLECVVDTYIAYCAKFHNIEIDGVLAQREYAQIAIAHGILANNFGNHKPNVIRFAARRLIIGLLSAKFEYLDRIPALIRQYGQPPADYRRVYHLPEFWEVADIRSVRVNCREAHLAASDVVALRRAIIAALSNGEHPPGYFGDCVPQNAEELALWMRSDPTLVRLDFCTFTSENVPNFLTALRSITPAPGLNNYVNAILAIFAGDHHAYRAAVENFPQFRPISTVVAVARITAAPPEFESDAAIFDAERVFAGSLTLQLMIKMGLPSTIASPRSWLGRVCSAIGLESINLDPYSSPIACASEDPGWMSILNLAPPTVYEITRFGNIRAHDAFHPSLCTWKKYFVSQGVMDELVRTGRATQADRVKNARKIIEVVAGARSHATDRDLFAAFSLLGRCAFEKLRLPELERAEKFAMVIKMGVAWDFSAVIRQFDHPLARKRIFDLVA